MWFTILNLFSRIKTYLIVGSTILVLGTLAFKYVDNLQDDMNDLYVKTESLNATLARNKAELDQYKESVERQDALTTKLIDDLTEREQELTILRKKLREHDLKRLSAAKPGLIEKRVNDATKEYFDSLERITNR